MNSKIAPANDLIGDLTSILSGDTKKYQENSPSSEVEMGEQVIGVLSDPVARAIWNMSTKIKENMRHDVEEFKEHFDPDDKMMHDKFYQKMDNAGDIVKVCHNLFWVRVQTCFPQGHKRGLSFGVRNGWKVVVMKSDENPLLSMIMGMSSD